MVAGQSTQVTVIIVTYNSAGVIAQTLQACAALPQIASCIVVDNASTDETAQIVRRATGVLLLGNTENVGFGTANNRALARVRTPYALLLNPDASLDAAALSELLTAAVRYPRAAILAPLTLGDDGAMHHCYKRSVFDREISGGTFEAPEGDCCADFLSGAVWLVRMDALREIGFFDERLFLYYEDDDLCLRTRQKGYELIVVPSAQARHRMGQSTASSPGVTALKQRHMAWSRLYLERKYHGQLRATMLALRLTAIYLAKGLAYAMTGQSEKRRRYQARLSGVWYFTVQGSPRQEVPALQPDQA